VVFKDPDVGEAVNQIAETFGVPRHIILPVKNYEHEPTVNSSGNILTLMALKKLLEMARDHQERQLGDAVGGSTRDMEITMSDTA